ncbi:unnamed protein product [Clonostachys chloroleuca]|uniref:NmrA-like domain-containing protein n=1 Tax=Clonostachys chloroleuca TaxID=1926264 RepID=A0AA35PZ76_9HYPO|nr:unnamed protein product [Clonostachys chloroleuca]
MSLPILTVIGALGNQGRGVVSAFLGDKAQLKVHIRALTSNPSSESAQELAKNPNVSVVQVDLASTESIESALQGSSYIFANTIFDPATFMAQGAKATEERESAQIQKITLAASKVATLKHLVLSTLPDAKAASNGKYHIPHFQSKVAAEKVVLDAGSGLSDKTTFLRIGVYGSNFLRVPHRPVYSPETNTHLVQYPMGPDVKFAFIGDEVINTGIYVKAILEQPEKTIGRVIVGVADYLSCNEWAAIFQKVQDKLGSGSKVLCKECSLAEYEEKWGAIGTEVGLMMAYFNEFGEKSFSTSTWGWPVATAGDLGIEHDLRSTEETLLGLEWPAQD